MMIATLVLTSLLLPVIGTQDDADLAAARSMADSGDLAGATQLLTGFMDAGGGEAIAAGVLLSDLQIGAGDAEAALATLESLGAPNDPTVALALGRAYQGRADALHAAGASGDDITAALVEAQTHIERAMEHAPDGDSSALVALGYVRLNRFGDYVDALAIAKQGLEVAPEDGDIHLLKGKSNAWVYWNSKSGGDDAATKAAYDETVADYQKAVDLLPTDQTEALAQLAWIYGDRGEAEKAVGAAIMIVDRQDDPNFDLLYSLARQYSINRQFEASSKALEKMVSISAREISTRLKREEDTDFIATELAWSVGPFVNRQDQATARAILKAILAADPKSPEVWHNYAIMCEDTRRFEDALKAYEKSVELDSENARFYNDLGSLLHHALNRDLDRAKEMYETCIEKADEQLVAVNLAPQMRVELTQARNIAQSSLDELSPASTGGGLLDGLLDGLSSLSLPDLPDDEDEEAEADDAEVDAADVGEDEIADGEEGDGDSEDGTEG